MRHTPVDDEYDREELERLGPPDWQVKALAFNPPYVLWGPYEDYMWKIGEKHGWQAVIEFNSWKDNTIVLNDLNEVVNFYFEIRREEKQCPHCVGTGHHPHAQWVSQSFYSHSSPFAPRTQDSLWARSVLRSFCYEDPNNPDSVFPEDRANFPDEETLALYHPHFRAFCEDMRDSLGHNWKHKITQDEANALVSHGRLPNNRYGAKGTWEEGVFILDPSEPAITAEDYNRLERENKMGHDGINESFLVETRCKRFGIPVYCPECRGHGQVFVQENTSLALILWLLHPRKGASRGVIVKNIERNELPDVLQFLKTADDRNHQRFSKIREQVAETLLEECVDNAV